MTKLYAVIEPGQACFSAQLSAAVPGFGGKAAAELKAFLEARSEVR
jgi:hypothetical protein